MYKELRAPAARKPCMGFGNMLADLKKQAGPEAQKKHWYMSWLF